MTDWARVRADDFAVPTDRPLDDLVAELVTMLRSADPVVRDSQAYSTLATWIHRGVLDTSRLTALGDELIPRFEDPEIQVRTFTPLILDSIVSAGVFEPGWVPPFERWYVDEEDLRGYDPELGWLHAVAHGADLLCVLGLYPAIEPVQMLRLGIGRLLTPTSFVFRDLEDDRLGYALAATLTRADLPAEDATSWLDPALRQLVLTPEGVRPEISNTLRTLRMTYVLVEQGVRIGPAVVPVPHRQQVLEKLTEVFRTVGRRYYA